MSKELINTGAGLATGIIGMLGQRQREKRAMNNQKELMGIQFKNQQDLNQQGHDLQMQTWKDTNYPAQMEMIKEAGLNPALLYGQSGGGGTTTGSQGGGSAQSGSAPGPQPMELGTALQGAMTASMIELQKSQARKNNIEADKLAGIDTDKGKQEIIESGQRINESQVRIDKLIAETTNEKQKQELINWQTNVQKELASMYGATTNNLVEQNNIIGEQLKQMEVKTNIDQRTKEDVIKSVALDVINKNIDSELKKTDIQLKEEQRSRLENQIYQDWVKVGFTGLETIIGGLLKVKAPKLKSSQTDYDNGNTTYKNYK